MMLTVLSMAVLQHADLLTDGSGTDSGGGIPGEFTGEQEAVEIDLSLKGLFRRAYHATEIHDSPQKYSSGRFNQRDTLIRCIVRNP